MNERHLPAGLATSTHGRTGLSLLLLVFGAAVFSLTDARSGALGAQPRGQQAGVRQAERKPVRGDHAISHGRIDTSEISRIRIDTPEGVFLVYNSAMPPNTDQQSRAGRRGAGFWPIGTTSAPGKPVLLAGSSTCSIGSCTRGPTWVRLCSTLKWIWPSTFSRSPRPMLS